MKRSTCPTTRTHPAVRAAAALTMAFATAVLATLLLLYAPRGASAQEPTRQMPAGMEVGEDGVSINDGEIFAGDGCAKVGELEAGDCGEAKAGGDNGSGGGGGGDSVEPRSDADDGPSDEQYGAEDGSGSGASEATVLESTTSGGSGPEDGESTQSQTIESTTGVVEEESGGSADAEADPGVAGGEPQPEVVPEEVASEEGAAGAKDASQTCATEGPMGETTTTTVEEAVDGDTVETPEGTVRLIGVDTPETVDPGEPVEPGGKAASEFTAAELEGEEVTLEFGEEPKDDYGRALAYAWTEGEQGEPVMFNETLLREGMGELLIIPPNDEYERCLAAAEEQARAEGVGIWPEAAPPETTGEASAPEATATDETPSADDEEGQDGILGGLFGGEEPLSSGEDQYAGETTAPASPSEANETETTAPESEDSSVAEGQYEGGAAVEPAPPAPADEPEVQEPEKQEQEVQEPEIQEEEAQDPPARSSELAGAPAEISAELPTDDASVPPSSAPAAPDGTAAITTLPETGGASVLALTTGALLLCSGLVAASLARRARESDGGTERERVRG